MKNTRYLLTGLIMIGLLVAAVLLVKKNHPATSVNVSTSDSKTKGPKSAPVQIVEYSDFQCPACARVESSITKVLAEPAFAGKIHFVYRHFPLSGHRWSGLAHQAAECANEQGKFWEYHDKLYQEQPLWSELENPTEEILRYAREMNLRMELFGFCLANPEVHQRIMKEKSMGDDLQLRSTPTFFINGERVVGPVEFEMRAPEMIRKILGIVPTSAQSPALDAAPVASLVSTAVQAIPAAVSTAVAPAPAASASPSAAASAVPAQ